MALVLRSSFQQTALQGTAARKTVSKTPHAARLGRLSVNMPRQIRVRIARSPVSGHRKVKVSRGGKVMTPPSPVSPHQEATQNSKTGRFALGPWGGPFGTNARATDDSVPATLYMDSNGYAHYGLSSTDAGTIQLMRALKLQEEAERQEMLKAKAKEMEHENSMQRARAAKVRRDEAMRRQARMDKPRVSNGRQASRSAAQLFQPRRQA